MKKKLSHYVRWWMLKKNLIVWIKVEGKQENIVKGLEAFALEIMFFLHIKSP